MSKIISEYPVTNKYSATHSGEDRSAPEGVPIYVSGTLLGYVGHTGKVVPSSSKTKGDHLHIQEARLSGNSWIFQNPQGRGLNVLGRVVEVGYDSVEKGNYVRVLADNGLRYSYFHMTKYPLVKNGDTIGGLTVAQYDELKKLIQDARDEAVSNVNNSNKRLDQIEARLASIDGGGQKLDRAYQIIDDANKRIDALEKR